MSKDKKGLTNIPTGMYVVTVKQAIHKAPEETRRRILAAAFEEFYRHGFQGGSLSRIVEKAGITKGALFHHFSGKQQLGYAVLDEVIGPLLGERWIAPITESADPLADLQNAFRRYVQQDLDSGHYVQGCPLNNLAQEMSPLDPGFRSRIDGLYDQWRKRLAAALADGMRAGTVRRNTVPEQVAALVVASQMGIYGTAKSSQDKELTLQAAEALCGYLEALKPQPAD